MPGAPLLAGDLCRELLGRGLHGRLVPGDDKDRSPGQSFPGGRIDVLGELPACHVHSQQDGLSAHDLLPR